MTDIKPFKVAVSDERLEQLREKLDKVVFPDELDNAGSEYGAPLGDIKRLVHHWRTSFDWRAQEVKMNAMPQYTTSIQIPGFDALDIHFVHQKSDMPGAIPLLFVHGWPGSFLEVAKLLPLLRGSGNDPAFSIVAPSLPNFGFSEGVGKKGFGLKQYAAVCNGLMLKLGYNQYGTPTLPHPTHRNDQHLKQ